MGLLGIHVTLKPSLNFSRNYSGSWWLRMFSGWHTWPGFSYEIIISSTSGWEQTHHFTSKRQGKWIESLYAVEFAINLALNIACGVSPFEHIMGQGPHLFPSKVVSADSPKTLSAWLQTRENLWATAQDQLWVSQVKQELQNYKRWTDRLPLLESSWVLLESADWRGRHQGSVSNLKEQFEGP